MKDGPEGDALVDFDKLNRVLPFVFAGLAIIAILPWSVAMPSDEGLRMLGWTFGVGTSVIYPLYVVAVFSILARDYRFEIGRKVEGRRRPVIYQRLIRTGFYAFLVLQLISVVLMWV